MLIWLDDTNEGSYFAANAASPEDVAVFFQTNFPLLTTNDTDAINSEYPLMAPLPDHNAYFPSASAAYGESVFTCPGLLVSQTLATLNSPYEVWNYRYNVIDNTNVAEGLGVPHVFEQPAIMGLGNANDPTDSSYSTYNANIIPVVMNYWISFVRDLTPNRYKYVSAPHWESYGDRQSARSRLVFQTNDTVMETVPQDQLSRCAFWKGLAVTMEQ